MNKELLLKLALTMIVVVLPLVAFFWLLSQVEIEFLR